MTKRRRIVLTGCLLFATAARPCAAEQRGESRIRIAIEDHCQPPRDMALTKLIAERIFAAIGIDIEWLTYRRNHPSELPSDAVVVMLKTNTPPGLLPGAVGYALPFEGTHVQVFYDRIQADVEQRKVPILTAHVLAHEVTHIIERTDSHSTGVMKARWDSNDYSAMMYGPLSFSAADVMLIRRGLDSRTNFRASAAAQESADR
jgi:hypothetical protein